MSDLKDQDVRDILRPHRDGGAISRLYATGEISEGTYPALGMLTVVLEEDGKHEEAERIGDVISYIAAVDERPAVAGWVAKL